ncbi:hypothetical protein Taro_017351, partial [Colocasia esculenta]|nr:hypothetical protein [Colocasia esculenta]
LSNRGAARVPGREGRSRTPTVPLQHQHPNNGGRRASESALNGGSPIPLQPASHGVDSTCSTRYANAPSSPGRGGDFFSAPASPMHFVRSSFPYTSAKPPDAATDVSASGPSEFEFSARGSMTSADKLFLNGKIRPMRLSAHLQRPQIMAPFLDLEAEEDEEGKVEEKVAIRGRDPRLQSKPLRRRARSMSPLRKPHFQWRDVEEGETERTKWAAAAGKGEDGEPEGDRNPRRIEDAEPSGSGWSFRSSSISSSRSSRKWISLNLKDILYRSKSEGRGDAMDNFWHADAFSPSKDKSSSFFFWHRSKNSPKPPPDAVKPPAPPSMSSSEPQKQRRRSMPPSMGTWGAADGTKVVSSASSRPEGRLAKRRVPAVTPWPHERHYTANRAQAEEMRKKTFLPYRQGILGCLWFSSWSCGAMNGTARALNR